MRKAILTISFLLLCSVAWLQVNYTVSGTVFDAATGETVIGARFSVIGQPGKGAVTNEYGFFSLTLPAGSYRIGIDCAFCEPDTLTLLLEKDTLLDYRTGAVSQLEEVVVISEKSELLSGSQMGKEQLDVDRLNRIPVLFGERDIVKAMQLLPGVKSGGDGNSGFYVRGGGSDQNLIVLDEAVVYNASHLFGFFSTFNSDAIKDAVLYKGTQPAQYGGRLSSALDIHMKEGNKQQFEANGSLGLISSKLSVEGPIVKDKSSFFLSGRRTYADLFLAFDEEYKGTELYFYDLNAKVNYRFGQKNTLYASGYFGRDNLGLENLFGLDWGNATGTVRWNHIFSSKLFSNTSAIFSEYRYAADVERGGSDFTVTSSIRDYTVKQEFQWYPSTSHQLRFGVHATHHTILPGEVSGESVVSQELERRYSLESGVFISDDWTISSRWSVQLGLRFSDFSVLGPGNYYTLDAAGAVTDTSTYGKGDVVHNYFYPEPRVGVGFIIDENSSVKASYTRNVQYLHLISNTTAASPTDKWISSTNTIRPGISDQLSAGYFRKLGSAYELSAETYYKALWNQVDYRNGADVLFNTQIETQLLSGRGRAYGVELLLRKNTGRLTGWIGYTLSRTERKIEGINDGNWYVARQDKTHDISVVLSYEVSKQVSVSANWVYGTGNAVTFPTGKYYVDEQVVWLFSERNGYRLPAYHRLDLGVAWKLKERRHWRQEIAFGIYNAYGRENAYMVDFRESEADPSVTEVVQIALFRFVPSISWNFKIK